MKKEGLFGHASSSIFLFKSPGLPLQDVILQRHRPLRNACEDGQGAMQIVEWGPQKACMQHGREAEHGFKEHKTTKELK